MKIAIYGAGSIGTVLGAYLARAGMAVDLISRNAAHIAALKANGATIKGAADFSVAVNALLPDEMSEKYNIIFLITKQLYNANVVRSLLPFLAQDGAICTMQNGLPELSVSEIVGEQRTYGCAIGWGAEMTEAGVCNLTSEADALIFSLGSFATKNNGKMGDIATILQNMGTVEIEENFIGARWVKLLVNSAFSGLSAVFGCTFGQVADNKKSRLVAQKIIKECIDVAAAAGIKIEKIQGIDVVKLLDYSSWFKQKISFMIIPLAIKKHKSLKASMLQDIERGKPCEIDAINGIVCLYGQKYSVPTPYSNKVVEIVKAIEKGKYKPSFNNLKLFVE
jgi:2-dehydropantoate 2-reductase